MNVGQVSVVIPSAASLDEVERACQSVLMQNPEGNALLLEVVVAQAGSDEQASEMQAALAARLDERVRVLANPSGLTPRALNLAIEATTGSIVARLDTHAIMAPDYLINAWTILRDNPNVDITGGPLRSELGGPYGPAMEWALTSRYGVGGSHHHYGDIEGDADSVYLGVFRKATFETFGLFDENMKRNQDDEYTYRVRSRGGCVWLASSLHTVYLRQYHFRLILRQFYGYGRYKPEVLVRHPRATRLRHLAPSAALISVAGGLLTIPQLGWIGGTPLAAYVVITGGAAIAGGHLGAGRRFAALVAMHSAYGAGYLIGAPKALRWFVNRGARGASATTER